MGVEIENENTFRRIFYDGMNLFLGAGFPVLAKDANLRALPTGAELFQELLDEFKCKDLCSLSLPQLCTVLESHKKVEFRQYLTDRFTVHSFDPEYDWLNYCNIRSIFTTNIDNLLFKIFEPNDLSYLNDVTQHGPFFNEKCAINYIPLHGSILNSGEPLVFSSTDIAVSFSRDPDRWHFLTSCLQKAPSLFWGCSLADADILKSLNPETIRGREHKAKWIVLKQKNKAEIEYFQALDFFIIIGDTREVLEYIRAMDLRAQRSASLAATDITQLFPEERIPKEGQFSVRPLLDFYMGAEPRWPDIFSGALYRTSYLHRIIESINSGKNTVVIGIPACGKTTLMMQVAAEIPFRGTKLVSADLPVQKAELIVKRLGSQRLLMFVDNFTDNIDGFSLLARAGNVLVVGFDRDYNFEIASHKIERHVFNIIDVTELTEKDRQELFLRIPVDIREKSFKMPRTEQGVVPSLYEVMEENITRPKLGLRFKAVLDQLERESYSLHDLFVMCCYVHSCRTPVSFDMAYAFLRDEATGYQYVYEMLDRLGALVADYCGPSVDSEQDYFVPRSTVVSFAVLKEVSEAGMRRTILRFHKEVSPYRICKYDVFKTKAFDKDIVLKAFPEWKEGMFFYESMYARDKSAYLLQQGALYLSHKRRFTEAFSWIDRAVTETAGRVFSIRNSHAVILFRANIGAASDETRDYTLRKSMDILAHCYQDDKRKIYHALVFADQALQYWDAYGNATARGYLITAQEWLKDESKEWPSNRNVRRLMHKVSDKLART